MYFSVLHAFRKTNGAFYGIFWLSRDSTSGGLVPEQWGGNQGVNEVQHESLEHSDLYKSELP